MKSLIFKLIFCNLPFLVAAQTNPTSNLYDANVRLIKTFQKAYPSNSIFYSPYSISTAFAVLREGAEGKTAKEIQESLGLPNDIVLQRDYFSKLQKNLNMNDKCLIHVNNAIWVEQKFSILESFKENGVKFYDAYTQNLDFMNNVEMSRQTINAWVEQKTKQLIKNALPEKSINERTSIVLTNTIYFKGKFEVPFDSNLTKKQIFRNKDMSVSLVQMMQHNDIKQFRYFENNNMQLLELPYQGGVSLWIVLPKKNTLNNLAIEELKTSQSQSTLTKVKAFIPKFKLETSYDMIPILKQIGIKQLFSDTSNLMGISNKKLKVSSVIHKAYIDVSEERTEAAAFTGMVTEITTSIHISKQAKIFRVDHPFLFFIQDMKNDVILFSGVVESLGK